MKIELFGNMNLIVIDDESVYLGYKNPEGIYCLVSPDEDGPVVIVEEFNYDFDPLFVIDKTAGEPMQVTCHSINHLDLVRRKVLELSGGAEVDLVAIHSEMVSPTGFEPVTL